jgi:hypothetical protein
MTNSEMAKSEIAKAIGRFKKQDADAFKQNSSCLYPCKMKV